jgi:hypothetical protein
MQHRCVHLLAMMGCHTLPAVFRLLLPFVSESNFTAVGAAATFLP